MKQIPKIKPRKKCKPHDHGAGSLSYNNDHLVCDVCLEMYDMDLTKWNPNTFKGPIVITEFGEWPG